MFFNTWLTEPIYYTANIYCQIKVTLLIKMAVRYANNKNIDSTTHVATFITICNLKWFSKKIAADECQE